LTQNHPSNSFFSFPFIEISDFHIYFVFYFVISLSSCTLVCSSSLCDIVCFSGFSQVFDRFRLSVQLQLMTLASSTLQIRRHDYSGDLNIVICVGICTLPFYAINMNVVSLFTDSSFLFLENLHYIDVLYQFE